MQSSASVSTSGVPSQGSGGGAVRGLKAESFNQLVERARMQLARAPKVVNDNLEDVKVSTTFFVILPTFFVILPTFFVIVHTLNVYVKCQKQYWQFWLENVYV